MLVWKKEPDKAIAAFTEAIRLEPNNWLTFCMRGAAWQKKRDHGNAIKDFSSAIELDPSNAKAYWGRADSWHEIKEYRNALSDYERAFELGKDDGHILTAFAWLLTTCPNEKFRDGKRACPVGSSMSSERMEGFLLPPKPGVVVCRAW